eukprot:NODE_20404_length_800_cov_1.952452.p4 GENE.NODE_20404_length_800_cov_1.952452~~NODE_20404_length_800_cov_1.952452.p4  ORF type:complete len:107 (+),score=43.78 NODE_20404_length_800_cov_1.952452:432-752(+)
MVSGATSRGCSTSAGNRRCSRSSCGRTRDVAAELGAAPKKLGLRTGGTSVHCKRRQRVGKKKKKKKKKNLLSLKKKKNKKKKQNHKKNQKDDGDDADDEHKPEAGS